MRSGRGNIRAGSNLSTVCRKPQPERFSASCCATRESICTPVIADGAARSPWLAIFRRGTPPVWFGAGGLGRQGSRPARRSRQRGSILPIARPRVRRCRLAEGGGAGGLWRSIRKARRANDLRRARDFVLARQPRRFCLRHAGPGDRFDIAVRQRRDQGQISAAGSRGPPHRGVCVVGAGSGV